jgi:hypothetical protein
MDNVSRRDALVTVAAGAALAATGAAAAAGGKDEPKEKHDLKRLEERIDLLAKAMAKLGDGKDLKELIPIIRKPGWTTPAEFLLVAGVVDSMIAQAEGLAGLKEALVKGSRAVGAP